MLAIAGGKGGVGKTTVALGLAVALAARRRDPIVVDADVDMPNLHLLADVPDGGVGALAAGAPVDEAATPSARFDGVRVLGARHGAPIDRALRALVADDPVLIDVPAGVSPDAVDPLRVADQALVVTTPDPRSVRDAEKTAEVAAAVGTPVVAWIVSRTDAVPQSVAAAAETTPTIPVPAVRTPPLDARRAFDAAAAAWVNA